MRGERYCGDNCSAFHVVAFHACNVLCTSRILNRGLPLGRMCAGSGWMIWGVGAKEAVGGRSCWLLVPASDACCWSWGVGCGVLLMCIDGVFKKKALKY